MNEKIEHLLKQKNFKVDSFTYSAGLLDNNLHFDIKATLYPGVVLEPINELENMNNTKLVTQNNFVDAIRCGGNYIVGSVDSTGALSFSQNPAYHSSAATARAECKRLAKLYPGKLYLFVGLQGGEMVPSNAISI